MSTPGALLGIDVGTGGTRALLLDERGRILGSATSEHAAFASPRPGWAEQDPRDWWRATGEAVRGALTRANIDGDAVTGIGLSGQMHGSVMLDDRDDVVRPALLWCDQRTADECREITETVGAARLIEWVSNPALTGFTLPKLLWVRSHEPELWARVRSVLLPKDYVRFRLTGERATDVADASGTLMFDVARRKWSSDILRAMDVSASLLPRVYESPETTGVLSAEGARGNRLARGDAGGGGRRRSGGGRGRHGHRAARAGERDDRHVGRGVRRDRSAGVRSARPRPYVLSRDSGPLARDGRHAGRGPVAALVPRSVSASCPPRRADGGTRDPYEYLSDEAAAAPAGAEGLIWTPYLMGERTPHLDPHARAALVGLSASHTRAHVVRAILEGVAFSLQDTFEIFSEMQVPVTRVRLGGGGARSPIWRQIQADVYGHDAEIVEAEEGAAYGAALLAGVGCQVWPSVDAACDAVVRVARTVTVDPDARAALRQRYNVFRRVYPALRALETP